MQSTEASSQIVVHRHHMHTLAGHGVEEDGERSHERLTLAGGHLGDLALVKHHAAEELHVVVHHVPLDVIASGHPVCGIDGLVAVDGDEVLLGGKVAVEIGSRNHDGVVLGKAACRILHDGEGLGQYLVEFLLDLVVDTFGRGVYVLRYLLLVRERSLGQLQLGLLLDDMCLVGGDEVGYLLHQGGAAGAELIVREFLYRRIYLLDLVYVRLYLFAILIGF